MPDLCIAVLSISDSRTPQDDKSGDLLAKFVAADQHLLVDRALVQQIEGFGELFRQLSYTEIGTSTIQSRAVGGLANGTLIFSLPGSSGAVTLGWEKILHNQLDINFRPCNFAELIPRFLER